MIFARMLPSLQLLAVFVAVWPTSTQGLPQLDISGLVGQTIRLPCQVDEEKCGELHSIKWYRGSSRIFVFSDKADISRSEGDYVNRAELHYAPNTTKAELEVKQLTIPDEAVYKCEITYIEVREGCAVVQFINLTALIKPEYVKVTRGDGAQLQNGSVIGPFTEGDELSLECESGGGKPIPSVTWWNGTHKMAGKYTQEHGANSVGTGRSKLHLTLGRGDLGAKYECRADNAALDAPITSLVEVEVNVRPLKLELSGLEHHVVQGTTVVLKCEVVGARPAANVTWYNGTEPLREDVQPDTSADQRVPKTKVVQAADGTYTTQSRLEFQASRFENGGVLSCKAINPVMSARQEPPLEATIPLEVLYPPIVYLRQDNVSRDEGQDFHLFVNYTSNPNTLKAVRWYRDGVEVIPTPGRYEGSTVNVPNLTVKNASRNDQGVYTVVLENEIEKSETTDAIYVSIYFKPTVALMMEPSTHVRELDRMNITLVCRVESGNPDLLVGVRWYLEGDLLKELPDCEGGANDTTAGQDQTFCDIDPSRLLLENVERGFHGNYSCEGRNEAGWGPVSQDQELVVFYPPGPATLVYSPPSVVKKGSVTLNCSVDEPGYPETTTFRWMRGSHHIQDVTASTLTIQPVTLETQSNFSCLAYNEGGEGEPASVYINVLAPPVFIERPPLYYGALMGAHNVSVSCRVECSPLCAIHWYKDGVLLDKSSSKYTVINSVLSADSRSNDFQSTLSTLVLNISAWPGGKLDRIHDNANYTCKSDGNAAGQGVQANATFRVEYPPENITVSKPQINVVENVVPEKVLCTANGYPEAQYQWYKEGENNTIKGNALNLGYPLKRHHGGNYICEASNRHGRITEKTFINVLYKPECAISQTDMAGKLVLVCTVHANPTEVDFTWRIKNENDTIEENIEKKGLQSHLTLDSYIENFRTYVCFANNSVGVSIPCEQDVTAHISWWGMEKENMIIIVAVVVGAIIMVLIVCVIIIIVCRRKRADDKYNNPVELEERENPEGDASSQPGQAPPQPVHKWPLRPGVLVHVNGTHSLSLRGLPQLGGEGTPQSSTPTHRTTGRRGKKTKRRRAVSMGTLASPDETNQHSRANRIRQMFSNDYRGDTLPGIIHSKSEVVTFKKLDGQSNHGVSRKRKKPGADPNPLATKDKSKPDLMSSPNDGLLSPDGDKAFYENLPFHGMQTAPNKLVAPSFSTHVVSRPSSQLSHNGSSGYGSTRSHNKPHHLGLFSGNKCSSLRVNRHKRGQSAGHFPKFYSLRLRKRSQERSPRPEAVENTGGKVDSAFQLHSMPIQENSPGEKVDSCEMNNNNNSNERSERCQANIQYPIPVPAPRKQLPNKVVRHTYQNVPIPITPNSQELTPPKSQHHHHHHHHYNLMPSQHHLLTIPPNSQQCGSLKRSSVASRNYLPHPPVRLEYQQPFHLTDSIVYADLALASANARREPNYPPCYRPPQASTEYAILKFHDVGQEIDV